jgi:hypothetical protein
MSLLKKIFKPVGKIIGVVFKPIGKLLKKWLTPKIDQPTKDGFEVQKFGANNPIPIVYGPGYVAGTIVDLNVSDSAGGIKNENLHILVVFCVGPVDVCKIFLDGEPIENPRYAGKAERVIRLGQPDQGFIAEAVGRFERFDIDNSTFPGLVYAYIKLIQDNEQKTFNGIPEITAWVSGRRVANLPGRGGFWWTNPAVCLYDYLTDPIWGAGLQSSEIDVNSFITAADECDELVPVSYRNFSCTIDSNGVYSCTESPDVINTTKNRHTISTVIDTSRSLFDNMQQISNVFRGFWPDSDGRVKIGIEQEGSPVFSFDESNVLRGTMTMSQPDVSERYNRVTVRYQDTRQVTKPFAREVSYPPPGDAQYTAWLAEDNGVPHELTIDADGIGNPWEAQQLAIVAARTSRANAQFEFEAQPEATQCDVGDIVSLTWDDYGFINKTLRISDITYKPDGTVRIQAVQHENAVYPWTNLQFDDITGGSFLGDPDNPVTVPDLSLIPDPTFASIGKLTWTYEQNRFVRKFLIVGYRANIVDDEPLPLVEYIRAESVAKEWRVDLIDISGQTLIEYRVFAVSTTGAVSAPSAVQAIVDYPAAPISLGLKPSNFEVVSSPLTATVQPLGTVFDIEMIGASLLFQAVRTATFTGLVSATTYSFRARTVNAFGKSVWFTENTTTTADAGPILDLIGEGLIDNVSDIVLPPLLAKIDELADVYDTRELIPAGVADAFTDLDLSREVVSETTVRREETRTLAASYTQLQADFTTEQGVNIARYSELTVAISTEESARIAQYTLLETRVEDNEASIGTTSEAVSDLEGSLATQVTRIDAVTTQSNALVLQVSQAEADIQGNAEAIAGLRVAVAGVDSQSQAELILSATVTNASQAVGRAYLGVQSVTAGVATINGIVVDGATNRIEFRANNVLFTDAAGIPSIYFDTASGKFLFKGTITASDMQAGTITGTTITASDMQAGTITGTTITGSSFETTSDFGLRTVISPSVPLWYGSGAVGGAGTRLQATSSGFLVNSGFLTIVNTFKMQVGYNGVVSIWLGAAGATPTFNNGLFVVDAIGALKCTGVTSNGGGSFDGFLTAEGANIDYSDGPPGTRGVTAKGQQFDFFAAGTGTYGPFTGSHMALILKSQPTEPGQIIKDAELIAAPSISTTITRVEVCSSAACKSVVGAVVQRIPLDIDEPPPALVGCEDIAGYADLYDLITFNAVGEGLILACGDLEPGDLLTSSAAAGVAVKQSDDIIRSSTIAKCRQYLSASDGVKLVAVIYLAG